MNQFYFIFYQSAMVLSLLISLSIIVLMWHRHRLPGGKAMIAMAASTFVWTLGFFCEAHSNTLEQQLFFNNIGYIGSMSVSVAWFSFALQYISGDRLITRWKIILLCIIPLTTVVLVWSNPWHHLMWSNEHLITSGLFLTTAKTYGPFFWVAAYYNYFLIVSGSIILVRRLFTRARLYLGQAVSLIIAVILPFIWNIIYVFNLVSLPRKDLTPVMFAISGIAIVMGLMRFRLFEIVPFAYKSIIQQLSDGIFVFDTNNYLLEVNPAALKIIGLDADVVGKKLKELVSLSPVLKQLSLTKPDRFELLLQVGGEERFYDVETRGMCDNQEQQIGWLVIAHDITRHKHAEKERLELERQNAIANKLASVGELTAGIAHEINNPLTSILGFTELLMERDIPEDIKADLQIILDSAMRTADITRRMLIFSRQQKPQRVLCDINGIITSTLKLRSYYLETNHIKVISEFDPSLPQTMADANQLQQVIINLIINAEYEMIRSHGSGNLRIKTDKVGNLIRIMVKDNGPGISKENMEKLFQPFFTTKKVGEGTGLGLSICHGIIAEHNGRIYAESEVGEGTTFIIELPIVEQTKSEEYKPVERNADDAGEAVTAKILVIDDESLITSLLEQILTTEGYEVRVAGKATEALKLIEAEDYTLILLDIKMPEMNGMELYQKLAEIDKSIQQKVIFLTGDILGEDTRDFFSRTGAPYIAKPFISSSLKKELRERIKSLKS